MKTLFNLIFFSVVLSCGSNNGNTNAQTSNITTPEKVVQTDETDMAPLQEPSAMPVGEINMYDLKTEPHKSWFNPGFENYQPSEEAMEVISNNISDYEIKIFMGTWCPDSRREVPKFFKILELADVNPEKVTMYGVNHQKETPDQIQAKYNITHVPTFIFFKNGEEVNRFVEYPQSSLEEDIAKIVSNQEYTNSYE